MFLNGSCSIPVHESPGHLHGLILSQGDAAAHAPVVLIPVPHIDLRLAAVLCDHVDLIIAIISGTQKHLRPLKTRAFVANKEPQRFFSGA